MCAVDPILNSSTGIEFPPKQKEDKSMKAEAKLLIPAKDNSGADLTDIVERNIAAMCKLYGGATVYDARGYWVNEAGRLFVDPVVVICSQATSKADAKEDLRGLAKDILAATDQEAVFLSVAGEAEIIE
jgi:hypothetical protein